MKAFVAALLITAAVLVPAQSAAAAPAAFSSTIATGSTCSGVPGGAPTAALQLTTSACTGAAAQRFAFSQVSIDVYTIATLTAGSCVDISGRSTADNAAVIQYPCNSQTNQQFRLQLISGSSYNIVAVHSGKCIASAGSTMAQLPCTSTRVWTLVTGLRTFTNPLSLHGPDPWLTYYNGFYYLATPTWNRTITMRRSRTLGGLASTPDTVIFNLTRRNGAGTLWAPEFHLLNGPDGQRWYLYYVAGQEPYNLGTQRIHVLESAGLDPMGPYSFKADLLDPTQNNTWELDPGILPLNGQLYLLGTFSNGSQPMFIRPLSNPWTASGTRHLLASPTFSWETVGGAVNEAPEVISHGGKTFQRSNANGVYGPGHNGFFKSPDGTEDWIVYHANNSASGGCDMNRTTRAQKFTWNADGTPNFGTPVALGTQLTVPSGEPAS